MKKMIFILLLNMILVIGCSNEKKAENIEQNVAMDSGEEHLNMEYENTIINSEITPTITPTITPEITKEIVPPGTLPDPEDIPQNYNLEKGAEFEFDKFSAQGIPLEYYYNNSSGDERVVIYGGDLGNGKYSNMTVLEVSYNGIQSFYSMLESGQKLSGKVMATYTIDNLEGSLYTNSSVILLYDYFAQYNINNDTNDEEIEHYIIKYGKINSSKFLEDDCLKTFIWGNEQCDDYDVKIDYMYPFKRIHERFNVELWKLNLKVKEALNWASLLFYLIIS